MSERPPFTVISNDAPEAKPEEPSPVQAEFNALLMSAAQHCCNTSPLTAMLIWESVTPDGPELRWLTIPGSDAVTEGLLKMVRQAMKPYPYE